MLSPATSFSFKSFPMFSPDSNCIPACWQCCGWAGADCAGWPTEWSSRTRRCRPWRPCRGRTRPASWSTCCPECRPAGSSCDNRLQMTETFEGVSLSQTFLLIGCWADLPAAPIIGWIFSRATNREPETEILDESELWRAVVFFLQDIFDSFSWIRIGVTS